MREEIVMASAIDARSDGLCTTCNNAPTCTCRATRGFDAQHCEMFDDYSPAVGRGALNDAEQLMARDSTDQQTTVDDVLFSGLCVNCENRHTCRAALSAGGIWHCEEYR